MQWSDQPFQPLSVPIPGGEGRRAVARFVCSNCQAKEEFTLGSGKLVPEMVIKKAVAAGWDAKDGRLRCRCPRCSRSSTAGERPGPKIIAPTNVVVTKEAPKPVKPAAPSLAKRFKVIDLIESHLDTKTGSYSGGMDDQSIASKAEVPIGIVIEIRQELFGVAEVKKDTTASEGLRKEFETEMLRIDASIERLERELFSLRESAERTQTTFLARLWALETKGGH